MLIGLLFVLPLSSLFSQTSLVWLPGRGWTFELHPEDSGESDSGIPGSLILSWFVSLSFHFLSVLNSGIFVLNLLPLSFWSSETSDVVFEPWW